MENGRRTARKFIVLGIAGILLGITTAGSGAAVSFSRLGEEMNGAGIGYPDALSQALSGSLMYISVGGFVALIGLIALIAGIVLGALDDQQNIAGTMIADSDDQQDISDQ